MSLASAPCSSIFATRTLLRANRRLAVQLPRTYATTLSTDPSSTSSSATSSSASIPFPARPTTSGPAPPQQAPAPFEVFDRTSKRRQRDRAVSAFRSPRYAPDSNEEDGSRSRTVDYLKDEIAGRMLDRFEDLKSTPSTVLDLSSSSGHLTKLLGTLEAVKEIRMTDLSENSLWRDKDDEFDLVPTRAQLDEEELLRHVDQDSQECVMSNLGLHWVNDLPGVLKQIRGALKPDGVFIGSMLGGDTLFELRTALQLAEQERTNGISPRISPMAASTDASNLLQRAGFTLLTVDVEDVVVNYPSVWELMEDLRTMGESNAILGRRPFIRRDVLIAADAIYKELHGNADGTIPATFCVIYLIGWKPDASQRKPLPRGSGKTSLKDVL